MSILRTKGYDTTWRPRGTRQREWLAAIQTYLAKNKVYAPFLGRQLFYTLVGMGIASKEPRNSQNKSYDAIKVNQLLNDARRARMIAWDVIADDDGEVSLTVDQRDAKSIAEDAERILVRYVDLDPWRKQERRIAIFVEAKGQVQQVETMVAKWRIPIFASGGFTSSTRTRAFGKSVADSGQPWHVLTIGDLDPSGYAIVTSREADITAFAQHYGGQVSFEHVALTIDQAKGHPDGIEQLNAEERTHAHAQRYPYYIKVQSAALPPAELETILTRHIEQLIDARAWKGVVQAEKREQKRIVTTVRRWKAAA